LQRRAFGSVYSGGRKLWGRAQGAFAGGEGSKAWKMKNLLTNDLMPLVVCSHVIMLPKYSWIASCSYRKRTTPYKYSIAAKNRVFFLRVFYQEIFFNLHTICFYPSPDMKQTNVIHTRHQGHQILEEKSRN